MAGIKNRVENLEEKLGIEEPITILVTAQCTDNLEEEGEIIHQFQVTLLPSGETIHEEIISNEEGQKNMKKKSMSTKFSFENMDDAMRGLDNLYRKKIADLRRNIALSEEDKQRALAELEREYEREISRLKEKFNVVD